MNGSPKVGAIIVAAGSSQRLGADKMFVRLGSRALLALTVSVFEDCPMVDEIVLVMAKSNVEQGRKLVRAQRWSKIRSVCLGGERRQDSVLAGLRRVPECSTIVIHDGARPLVTRGIIEAGLLAAQATGAAIAGVPLKDTVKMVDAQGLVKMTPNRADLRLIQTPQVFRHDLLLHAYEQVGEREFTDDAALLEAVGQPVVVYPGSYENIKVTTWEDVELVKAILRRRKRKTHEGGE